MSNIKHIIIEGLPATGKSEVSNLFKIYFPYNIIILPELTTVLVRKLKINIMKDRKILTDALSQAIQDRNEEINQIKKEFNKKNVEYAVIFEESHIGVHWAYSKVINDEYFLNKYDSIKKYLVMPDSFLRLMIPFELSYDRQMARNTPDVEVDTNVIKQMYEYLCLWHKENHNQPINVVDAHRSPDLVVKDIMQILKLDYDKLSRREIK